MTGRGIGILALLACLAGFGCGGDTTVADGDAGDVPGEGEGGADGDADADTDADTPAEADVDAGPDADVSDEASAESDAGADACPGTCGNGVLECAEQCDDGNTAAGDGCDASCLFETSPSCGDGNVDYLLGEQCDDGNTAAGDGCSATCRIEAPATCGNGVLDLAAGEQCDDGNTTAGDGCSPACRFEAVGAACGNGVREGLEVCDDGNLINGDACNPTCSLANTTTLFVGSPGATGSTDGVGATARLGGQGVLAVDASYLYLADGSNRIVRRIEIATATVQTIAGLAGAAGYVDDPVGTTARFNSLDALATNGTTLWVSDGGSNVVRAVSLAAPYAVTTLSGSGTSGVVDGPAGTAQFEDLRGLTYDRGYLYGVETSAGVVRRIDPGSGDVLTVAGTAYATSCPPSGSPVDGIGPAAVFCSPRYVTTDGSGMLYIADTNGNTIRSFNTVTREVLTFAGTGACGYVDGIGAAARIHRPRGLTSDGTSVYFVEFNAHTVRQGVIATRSVTTLLGTPAACTLDCSCGATPPPGGYAEGTGAAAQFYNPFSLAFHFPSNSLFLVDSGNAVIRRIQ